VQTETFTTNIWKQLQWCHVESQDLEHCLTCARLAMQKSQHKPKFHLARRVSTWHVQRDEPMHFSGVELVEQHSSTLVSRQARYVERVVSRRAKWNLGYIHKARNHFKNCIYLKRPVFNTMTPPMRVLDFTISEVGHCISTVQAKCLSRRQNYLTVI